MTHIEIDTVMAELTADSVRSSLLRTRVNFAEGIAAAFDDYDSPGDLVIRIEGIEGVVKAEFTADKMLDITYDGKLQESIDYRDVNPWRLEALAFDVLVWAHEALTA